MFIYVYRGCSPKVYCSGQWPSTMDRQPCHSFVERAYCCVKCRKCSVPWQFLSIDSVASLLWSTLSSDTRFFGATAVAAMLYFHSIFVQGVITSYITSFIIMLRAHCPNYRNTLSPTTCAESRRCQSIVVGSGHWHLHMRAGCSRLDITNAQYHAPHKRPWNILNPHDAHRLVAEASHDWAPHDIPCSLRCCSRHIILLWSQYQYVHDCCSAIHCFTLFIRAYCRCGSRRMIVSIDRHCPPQKIVNRAHR